MSKNNKKTGYLCKKAFTLAETLIVLALLGVIAVLTVKSLMWKIIESQNRTKLKKAMAVYEQIMNQMFIENGLQTEESFKLWADGFGEEKNNCANTKEYFKIVNTLENNPCRFKTAEKIWWDISNIENPIIILDEVYKNEPLEVLQNYAKVENDNIGKKNYVFALIGRKDKETGSVRVNDKAYEDIQKEGNNTLFLEKIYAFLDNRDIVNPESINNEDETIVTEQSYFNKNCIDNNDGKTCTLDKRTFAKFILENEYSYDNTNDCRADSNTCAFLTENSKAENGTYYTINIGGNISWNNAEKECKKVNENLKVANIAQLQKMYNDGVLKCSDGTLNCNFWAAEQTVSGSAGINYTSKQNYTYSTEKTYSSNLKQVICIGQ